MELNYPLIFVGRYEMVEEIGKGSYSVVYSGIDKLTNERVAMKLECLANEKLTLAHESVIYDHLRDQDGFPEIYHAGQEHGFNVLVMELLGPTLKKIFTDRGKFSLKAVLMLGDQLLLRLEQLHKIGYIHRDIKLANLIMGRGDKCDQVYIIDIGLGKQYKYGNLHILHKKNQILVGNPAFASRRAHLKHEISRRDDLESLGFVFMYLLRGNLPWRGIPADTMAQKLRQIEEIKLATTIESLCEGFPQEFVQYFHYCRGLKFTAEPDYTYLRQLLRSVGEQMNITYDNVFEWNNPENI
ncbi:Casein kinase Ialpha [Carabus blaptoides fortunei]